MISKSARNSGSHKYSSVRICFVRRRFIFTSMSDFHRLKNCKMVDDNKTNYRVIDNDWYFLFLYYSGYKSLWDLLRVSKFQWLGSILILGFQKIQMDCHNFQHLVCLAPWICKNRPKYTLFFNILTYRSRNNLILVPTPHNILGIMGGRDKN